MIIFLQGADTFRSQRFLQELKNKFIKQIDPNALSLSVLDGQNINLKDLGEKINTGSLFVKKRLVIIKNIFQNKSDQLLSALTNYLKKFTADENNIIIFHDGDLTEKNKTGKVATKKLLAFLKKQPYSQEFPLLNNRQLLVFIQKEAQNYQRKISSTASSLLINLTNNDLWVISSSIKKLAFYVEGETILAKDVKKMVTGINDDNIFALTDALSARDKKLAIELLEQQYAAGLSQEYLMTMLIRQFKILLQIRSALDQKMDLTKIASALKLHPFIIKKGITQARNFNIQILKDYLNQLINLDFLNKTGGTNIKTELALLISRL